MVQYSGYSLTKDKKDKVLHLLDSLEEVKEKLLKALSLVEYKLKQEEEFKKEKVFEREEDKKRQTLLCLINACHKITDAERLLERAKENTSDENIITAVLSSKMLLETNKRCLNPHIGKLDTELFKEKECDGPVIGHP